VSAGRLGASDSTAGVFFCDVRDVADLHLLAMTTPAGGGQRYLASGEFHWLEDIAVILRSSLGAEGKRVPRYRAPDFMVQTAGEV